MRLSRIGLDCRSYCPVSSTSDLGPGLPPPPLSERPPVPLPGSQPALHPSLRRVTTDWVRGVGRSAEGSVSPGPDPIPGVLACPTPLHVSTGREPGSAGQSDPSPPISKVREENGRRGAGWCHFGIGNPTYSGAVAAGDEERGGGNVL